MKTCICHEHKTECDCDVVYEDRPEAAVAYAVGVTVITAITVLIVTILFFLSSRPAGASHGPVGQSISYCCSSTNRASGTSYRMVAVVFSPTMHSVFETGAKPFTYVLQWPELEPTTTQLIRAARQRLAVVLAVDAAGPTVKEAVRLEIDWQHRLKALGMACLAGGLMLLISFWPHRKDGR